MRIVDNLDNDVIQENPLIEARKEMNVTEMRLFVLGLQDISSYMKDDSVNDINFQETIISYSELVELFGKENYGNIMNLKKQIKKASQCVIDLSSANGGIGFASIYRKIKYEQNKGLIIRFNDEIKPYISEIVKQEYTRYKVKALFSLSSVYAWRILELLLEQQEDLERGTKEIILVLNMEEVRSRLSVPKGLYEGKINNFRSRVLDLPISEINEKTDYFVWYKVKKTGRNVTGFKFFMRLQEGTVSKGEYQDDGGYSLKDPQSIASLISQEKTKKREKINSSKSQGLNDDDIKSIIEKYKQNDYQFDDDLIKKLKQLGHTPETFRKKYFMSFFAG